MNKIIVTDLDGTLFYPKDRINVICKKNLFFVQSFIDNGGKIVIASGRSLMFGKKVQKVIDREIDIIAYNGACIYSNNKIIDYNVINNENAKNIIDDIFNDYRVLCVNLMCDDGMYIKTRNDSKFLGFAYKIYYRYQNQLAEKSFIKKEEYDYALNNKKIFKILAVFGATKKADKRAEEATNVLNNSYSNIEVAWTHFSIEITAKNIIKGGAIEKYCELNNISKDNIYVVGDSGNDITMFKKFYEHSFVMKKAPKSVKRFAKYVINKFEDLSRYIYEK